MKLALQLAAKAKGMTSPNPAVGAVIVKRNKIIGTGYHMKAGADHAEIIALQKAGTKAKDATLYVTLEPCSHWGKTPPCTDAILAAGVGEVVVGVKDPNRKVDGITILRQHGVKVKVGILEEECKKLNEEHTKFMRSNMPLVTLKAAISLDGKIATTTGSSRYITGNEARTFVHKQRTMIDAVMIGINTALKDDPFLNPRLAKGKDPYKVVVDSKLKILPTLNLVKHNPEKLIIATTSKASKAKIKMLEEKGAKVLIIVSKKGRVDLKALMKTLAKQDITSIIIEGGATLNTEAIKEGIVDKVMFFINPSIIGSGISSLGDLGIKDVNKKIVLKDVSYRKLGKDIMVEGRLK